MLIAGWKELNNVPPLSRAPRWRKVNPKKLNSVCSCDPRRFLSLQRRVARGNRTPGLPRNGA